MKPSMYERALAAQSKRGTPEGETEYAALIQEMLREVSGDNLR